MDDLICKMENRDTDIENKQTDIKVGKEGWEDLGDWDWRIYTTDVCVSCSVVSDSLHPWTAACHAPGSRLLCPWDSLGKNAGVGCHSLLQGIFSTQGLNLGLLHYRQSLYHLSHQGFWHTWGEWDPILAVGPGWYLTSQVPRSLPSSSRTVSTAGVCYPGCKLRAEH